MSGKVYLVGAGPGDPKLITVRGLECIRAAEVLLYDRLLDPSLLDEAPSHTERVFVGKESDHHTLRQEKINELLAMHAGLGRNVVRLKGGDPFVFGRGGEEAAYLAERNIPFEIIPGISSSIAVPAFAGIPVTYRGISSSFAVVTGHSCGMENPVDYAAVFRSAGTLIILMGVKHLGEIVAQLTQAGIDPLTPIALVQEGTQATQRTVVSTLKDVVEDSREVQPPAVIVIGQVVSLRDRIDWFREASRAPVYQSV
jgi:uroporphyrin-III C-methyltransferase